MTRRLRSTAGVELALHELAPGHDTRRLLVAHATGFHGRAYLPLAENLSEFQVWAPDLRGHGEATSPADSDFRWEGLADDIASVVSEIGDDTPQAPLCVFGHSMGAAVALLAEARRPGTFRAIWAFEPIVYPPTMSHDSQRRQRFVEGTRRRRSRFDSFEETLANFASKPPFDVFDEACLRAYVEHGFRREADGAMRLKMHPHDESNMYAMSLSHPTWDHLPEVSCPVVVASGRVLPSAPSAIAEEVVARLPAGRLERFPDLDHMGPFAAPARIASRAQAFFDEVLAS
jgi:pimeloyl-ACP methyl ester carboxylesterase